MKTWVKWLKDCLCNHQATLSLSIKHATLFRVLTCGRQRLSCPLCSVVVLFSVLLYVHNFGANVSDNTLVSIVLSNLHDTRKDIL